MLASNIGLMSPQAKVCQKPPELEEAKNGFSPRASLGNMALLTLCDIDV